MKRAALLAFVLGCAPGTPSPPPGSSQAAPPSAAPSIAVPSAEAEPPPAASVPGGVEADGGRARLRALIEETDHALDERSGEEQLDKTLDAFEDRLVNDARIGDAAIQAWIDD